MFYHKAAVMGALVLKTGVFRLYALRIPSKRKRAAIGKTLELPEAKYLCTKKWGNSKTTRKLTIASIWDIIKQYLYIRTVFTICSKVIFKKWRNHNGREEKYFNI